MVVCRL